MVPTYAKAIAVCELPPPLDPPEVPPELDPEPDPEADPEPPELELGGVFVVEGVLDVPPHPTKPRMMNAAPLTSAICAFIEP